MKKSKLKRLVRELNRQIQEIKDDLDCVLENENYAQIQIIRSRREFIKTQNEALMFGEKSINLGSEDNDYRNNKF